MALDRYVKFFTGLLAAIFYFIWVYYDNLTVIATVFFAMLVYVICEEISPTNKETQGARNKLTREPIYLLAPGSNILRTPNIISKRVSRFSKKKKKCRHSMGDDQTVSDVIESREKTCSGETLHRHGMDAAKRVHDVCDDETSLASSRPSDGTNSENGTHSRRTDATGAIPKVSVTKAKKKRLKKRPSHENVGQSHEDIDPELREYFDAVNSTDLENCGAFQRPWCGDTKRDNGSPTNEGVAGATSERFSNRPVERRTNVNSPADELNNHLQLIHTDRLEHPVVPSKAMSDQMGENIERLLVESTLALDLGDEQSAIQSTLAAVVGAEEAKDKLILFNDERISEADLARWFGTCATILNRLGNNYLAARCFYTATVFDDNWTERDHIAVSRTLWDIMLNDFNGQKMLSLLKEMDKLATLAETRGRWHVALLIAHDALTGDHNYFLITRTRWKTDPIHRCKMKARCFLNMGRFKDAQALCMLIETQLAEYKDMETFEIWARSLLKDKKYDVAVNKVAMALKLAKKGEDKERLTKLKMDIQSKIGIETVNHEPDPDWLPKSYEGTATLKKAASTSNLSSGNMKKSKTRHRRPKARDRSKYESNPSSPATSASSSRAASPSPSLPQRPKATVIYDRKKTPGLQTNSVDQISSDGKRSRNSCVESHEFSTTDSSIDSDSGDYVDDYVDPCTTPPVVTEDMEDEQDQNEDESSYYEQTRRRYEGQPWPNYQDHKELSDEQMMTVGISLNMSYLQQFENRKTYTYYYPMESAERLKEMLLQRPDIYKRCYMQVEGCHVSYCHPIETKDKGLVIEISGRTRAGQTYNEDEVVVELLDKLHENKDRRYGKVIGILERKRYKGVNHPVFICTLDDLDTHHVRPLCKTIPKLSILNRKIYSQFRKQMRYKIEVYDYDYSSQTLSDDPNIVDISPGDRDSFVFLVAFLRWTPNMLYPRGAIIRMLKCGNTVQRGLSILGLKHKVPALYTRATYDRINGLIQQDQSWNIEPDRRNLSHLNTFTIDPPQSQDLDDALSIDNIPDGYRVGVHIADVSAIVEKDDPVDIEAQNRAVTYYSSIRRPRNMLPEPLSSNLCSLLPDQTRRTISVFFKLDSEGRFVQTEGKNYEIVRSLIKSRQRFTYREVQDILNESETNANPMKKSINDLFKLATKIRRRRLGTAMFALDVENDEELTEESLTDTLEAHYLVEEFMVMANRKIAEVLNKKFPDTTPIRCQPPPSKEDMESFLKKDSGYIDAVLKLQDKPVCEATYPNFESIRGDKSNRCVNISKILWEDMKKEPMKAMRYLRMDDLYPFQHIVYQHWISMQERAEYHCSDNSTDSKQKRHFSLNVYPYTHFTSPIRRYNDLVVHRLLTALLTGAACPYTQPEVQQICAQSNASMRRAKEYQRGCKALQKAIELKSNPQMIHCFVDETTEKGLSICAPELRHVDKRERQVSFNLLDMSRKPEVIEDASTNYDMVKGVWRKRIYDRKGVSSMPPNKGNPLKLNPNPGVVSIPLHSWASMLKCSVEGRKNDLVRTMGNVNLRSSDQGLDDVSTESLDPLDIQPNTVFSLTFSHGQTIKGQISSVPHKGLLAPRLVLYNMTNNVKLCLQHMDDPVLYLTKYATKATSKQYQNVQTYVHTWLPIILMESAVGAVRNEESCIINDVPVRFDSERLGKLVLPLGYCEMRNIDFSGVDDDDDESTTEAKTEKSRGPKSYDWLCLKFTNGTVPVNTTDQTMLPKLKTVWVGHAEITSVKRKVVKDNPEDGKITVLFVLHDLAPPLPQEARQKRSLFSVEVLCKSEVDRRTESYIKKLRSADPNSVAMKIALNIGHMPKLDSSHAHLASLIERDLYIITADTYPLPKNNKNQQKAIDKALTNRFSLIQGPPGTGKSYTGIKLMCLFDKINDIKHKEGGKRHQVLFCGPSNRSVDLVARWMRDKLGEKMPKFLRVYGRSIEAMDFPIPGRTFLSRRSTHNLKADEKLKSVSLHHLIRVKGEKHAEEINAFDKMFKANGYAPDPVNVKKYVHLIREASIEMIRKYDVILCTTAVGSNPKVLEATSVFQVIVDEAGMCPEPQCLVPILATNAEQVVLIGDHKQLRPIIMCREAAELGLDESLFERYSSKKNIPFTMLNLQYRMNPEICQFPSHQFYDGQLQTKPGMWSKDPILHIWPIHRGREYPHVLVHVEGEEKVLTVSTEEGNEQSKSNQQEIDVVVKVYKYLIENEGLDTLQINVMSQYNAQVSEIKKRLKEEQLQNYTVSTVVSSQGGEWDYVIFSTVRSLPDYKIEDNPTNGWCQQNLGFITDKNQINVALTRARKGLIIIGNKHLLTCDKVWKELISDYESKGCLKTPDEFPPKRKGRLAIMEQNRQRNIERYGDARYERGSATSYEGSIDGASNTMRGRGMQWGASVMGQNTQPNTDRKRNPKFEHDLATFHNGSNGDGWNMVRSRGEGRGIPRHTTATRQDIQPPNENTIYSRFEGGLAASHNGSNGDGWNTVRGKGRQRNNSQLNTQ